MENEFENLITNGPAFQFGMEDIARIREEFRDLVSSLTKLYSNHQLGGELGSANINESHQLGGELGSTNINESDFFDQHNDLCEVCGLPGEVLCCATCNLVFHMGCARPILTKQPDDDWKCAYCVAEGKNGGKKMGRERRMARAACRSVILRVIF